jgi:transcription antitermination factor NusG
LLQIERSSYDSRTICVPDSVADCPWYALWTHSHCEQIVREQLTQRGIHVFLPTFDVWSIRRGTRRRAARPIFPGYVFVRDRMEKNTHIAILGTRGVVRVLGERWDRLAAIPDDEMRAVERLVSSSESVQPFPYLPLGARVRVVAGPLAGVTGILVRSKRDQGLLVLSVHLLQRSVAVTIASGDVVPS